MKFPVDAVEFMDLMVTEHKRRLRLRRPNGETLRYMGETLDEPGRGATFIKLWVHNPKPTKPDPNDSETDLAMLQLYEHWRLVHHMRPIEPWDGSRLRPWLSAADNPAVPSSLRGDLSCFSEAVTRAPGSEVPWARLDAFGHAVEAHFHQVRRHAVWARPAIRPVSKSAASHGAGSHSHSLAALNRSSDLAMMHGDSEPHEHGKEDAARQEQQEEGFSEGAQVGKLRLYFHNELNNIETAPYSVRFWGFLKWADDLRKRLLGLKVAAFQHDEWSDIAFADRLVIKHFSWHDDVFSLGPAPRWDDQFGRYQTHGYPMGSQGYGVEFYQFHRDLVDFYNQWLTMTGRPKANPWLSGKHHTAYVMKYAGEAWWGRAGSNGRCLQPADVAPELLDPDLPAFDTLAELAHYLDVGWPTFHGVGHVQNCDIRDPYCNNYSIRFFGWHIWIDELFRVLERQGKPVYDEKKPLAAPIAWKWKEIRTPMPLLEGVWTYRSFHNDPDPNADPRWFVASLELREFPDGTLRGRLDSGDPDYVYEVQGFVDESTVRYELEPEWWDDRLMIVMRAVGSTAATLGHEYRYAAYYQPRFPTGKEQAQAFVGSVLRAIRPDNPQLEGTVGSFMAVRRGPLQHSGLSTTSHDGTTTQIFTDSGQFVVPDGIREIIVRAWGGGGGGGSDGPGVGAEDGHDGTGSSVADWLHAGGGQGGQHGVFQLGEGGVGGAAPGGSVGESGEKGGTIADESGRGGTAAGPAGGLGGARVGLHSNGSVGGYPGGGGSGAQEGNTPAGGGGGGGFVEASHKVTPGTLILVVVGKGGKGGDGGHRIGGAGAPGRVEISWKTDSGSGQSQA